MAELKKGYWIEVVPVQRHDGRPALCFVAKRTFAVAETALALEPLPDEAQPPILIEDRYDQGDAATAAPTVEGDLAPEKAAADVVVVGKSYAPGGKAATEWEARLRIGRVVRSLKLLGPRTCRWQPPRKQGDKLVPQPPVITPPTPVKVVELGLHNAYGGRTYVVPDPAELDTIRVVQQTVAAEQAERQQQQAERKQAQQQADKAAAEEAARDAIVNAPIAAFDDEEAGLRRARGQFGYDKEGVRQWGEATSQRGTAVMDLGAFEAWQQQQAERDAAARPDDEEEQRRRDRLRRDAIGDAIEHDEGVEILDAAALAKEQERARAEQIAWRQEWKAAARKRKREAVVANDGTRVLHVAALTGDGRAADPAAALDAAEDDFGDDDDDAAADIAWETKLRQDLEVADAERRAVLRKEIEALRKARAERLAEFPELPCPTNPYGKGFVVSNVRDLIDGLELPQIEDPAAPWTARDLVRDPLRLEAMPLPAGFSTWPRSARPRIDKAGAYPQEIASFDDVVAAQQRALDLEDDDDVAALRELKRRPKPQPMQPGFFNSAPPWLQLERLLGDEEIELDHLTPKGHLLFRLPARAVLAELDRGRGVERRDLTLDTLVIEPDKAQVTMVWRCHYDLSSFEELGTYPHLAAWVLDLDLQDKRRADMEAQAARARGEGTAVLDISGLDDAERGQEYWRTISDERRAAEQAAAPADGTAALDLAKMGLYRQHDDSAWEAEAAGKVVDVNALEKQRKAEEDLAMRQLAAVQALEERERQDAIRREEVAEAAKSGKPIPPPDSKKTPKQLAEAQKARADKAEKAAKAAQGGAGDKAAAVAPAAPAAPGTPPQGPPPPKPRAKGGKS